ncbi:MAG TPA: hypothetical protein PK752_03815 [Accumulibacter sp.]|uniref:hypothetical protein n=1 Tax=Accumulibacter sp. TaxID=2053492 RepID=UPI002C226B21|nr:hypothetical protein [Accumulibacter sp.]HRD87375.1 hypothetical protein [Accumulibacter sp.]
MARRSEAFEALTVAHREELEADILRGELSWRQLAAKFKVPAGTLRDFADRKRLVRNASGLKREMVASLLAKPDEIPPQETVSAHRAAESTQRSESSPRTAHEELEAAAKEDARDMRNGLVAARIALNVVGRKLMEVSQKPNVFEAREVKVMAETTAIAIRTIREIRGLDPKDGTARGGMKIIIKREESKHDDSF